MHIIYEKYSSKARLKVLENKEVKLFHKAILDYLKKADIALIKILKEENFVDALIKKNVSWAYAYDMELFYYNLTYVFFEDTEKMHGSERENDYRIFIALPDPISNIIRPAFRSKSICSYDFTSEDSEIILQEINSIEEFQNFLPLFIDKSKSVLREYIFTKHKEKIKFIKNDEYLQRLTNRIDNEIMIFLEENSLNNHLLGKILDYNLTYDTKSQEFLYCVTYAFNEPLRLQKSYQGHDSVYKSYTLYDDNYDVNKNTYSFQIKVNKKEEQIYYRIIPNRDSSFKFLSKTIGRKEKNILNKEADDFIDIIKHAMLTKELHK